MASIDKELQNLHQIALKCKEAGLTLPTDDLRSIPSPPPQPVQTETQQKPSEDEVELPFDIMRRQLREIGPVGQMLKRSEEHLLQTHSSSLQQPPSLPAPSIAHESSQQSAPTEAIPVQTQQLEKDTKVEEKAEEKETEEEDVKKMVKSMTNDQIKQFCSGLARLNLFLFFTIE